MTDELNISASTDGVDVSSKGEGTSRLVNAICDLGSPFTETAGLLGDVVRTYRQDNAIKALEKTKMLADENGVVLQPTTPKFLFDWIERVSLEEDEALSSMWAALLVSECLETHPNNFLFKRFLSDITQQHAECFMTILGGPFVASKAMEAEDALNKLNGLRSSGITGISVSDVGSEYLAELSKELSSSCVLVAAARRGVRRFLDPELTYQDTDPRFLNKIVEPYFDNGVFDSLKLLGLVEMNRYVIEIVNGRPKKPPSVRDEFPSVEVTTLELSHQGWLFAEACCQGIEKGVGK